MKDDDGRPGTDGPPPRRISRRAAVIATAAALAGCLSAGLGLTAAGSDAPARTTVSATPTAVPDARAVAAVLANRTRAVRERDRTAFMATVATAPAAYRDAQGRLFDNLLRLPLASWSETLDRIEPGSAVARVRLSYRLRGFDDEPVVRTRYLAFAPRAGSWTIAGDGSARGLADDADIFDGGPLTVVRGGHTLVVGDGPRLQEIAHRLDAAVPVVSGVVGSGGWRRRTVALVPADARLASALAGPSQDLDRIAAVATVAPTAQGPGADRVVVSPAAFARLNELGRDVVLTHELTHVATGGARDGRTPLWLIEGLADYVGYLRADIGVRSAARELRAEVAAGRLPAGLPGRADFAGSSPRLSQAYQEAWLACRMIAERYGEAALVRLYRAAGRIPEDTALRETLGVGRDRLTALWRGYLREELG
ncbi:hypothetical protein Acsp04_06890 [Actinomadura sp. NBRC 104425]|uniref:hypothetical protein n=1 Tax=Actinomadura sp. NBRC 104425 TaxID=3032204 RepID=UPI0024A1FD4A|nr:hypothetical protein [Actinomadura sp. NBRC 104425]GLZ10454.1 hypothetical protein Acsp04_06890 [Actinomadura sp. NBRC 104425]